MLSTPRPRPSAPQRLVVFPHAGGAPSFYRQWVEGGEDIEVSVVAYAGREQRLGVAPVADAGPAVAEVAGALRDGADPRPVALFGHSMGAILAYETALALAGEEAAPALSAVFVSARRAPSTLAAEEASPAPRTDEELLGLLRRHGGTPSSLIDDPELQELFLPALRADYQLVDSYRPLGQVAPLAVPVTALWGDEDPSATEELMLPWADVTTGAFHARSFTGGHFYLVRHREAVLRMIGARLAGGRGAGPA